MGKVTGFKELERQDRSYAPANERIKHFNEFVIPLPESQIRSQSSRCMDCGIPYCHNGCPVNNLIPDWNDLVYEGNWRTALETLHSTNNFPEFTGRICPAPCEAACTLNITDNPVTIKSIECAIIDRGWEEGWIEPKISLKKTGKRIAVVGSGPAGLACSQQLARVGHSVTLYERNARLGGLLRYGIPDFKMEKHLIDRRLSQMLAEGVIFKSNTEVGVTISVDDILKEYDAIVMTGGSELPRDMDVPGRDLKGVHFAMQFLAQQNRRLADEYIVDNQRITAKGKRVVVIGGGDTGSDCVGTSIRQGAKSVTQLEVMPKPPEMEDKSLSWPNWPLKLRTSTSHLEGADRDWSVATKAFHGENGALSSLELVRNEWSNNSDGQMSMVEVPGSKFEIKADLVLLAMGFLHPRHKGMLEDSGVKLDGRGNVKADIEDYKTSRKNIFAAGDMRRGQSLVVWAISEGRKAAKSVDNYLMGRSSLPD
ncbi:MAG: glutamate synthase subunit beta [Alphaproteobacteria bacterium]|nr:glutamate synthase subunit beta [Alphaproteobacteria bacterium]